VCEIEQHDFTYKAQQPSLEGEKAQTGMRRIHRQQKWKGNGRWNKEFGRQKEV